MILWFQAVLPWNNYVGLRRDVADVSSDRPASRWWSERDDQVAGALSSGGDFEQSDYSARDRARRHDLVHRARSQHGRPIKTGLTTDSLQPHESEFLRAWKMLNVHRPLGMAFPRWESGRTSRS